MADTDHHAALRELLASGTLSIVPSASIEALCDEVERLRANLTTAKKIAEEALDIDPADPDDAEIVENLRVQLEALC